MHKREQSSHRTLLPQHSITTFRIQSISTSHMFRHLRRAHSWITDKSSGLWGAHKRAQSVCVKCPSAHNSQPNQLCTQGRCWFWFMEITSGARAAVLSSSHVKLSIHCELSCAPTQEIGSTPLVCCASAHWMTLYTRVLRQTVFVFNARDGDTLLWRAARLPTHYRDFNRRGEQNGTHSPARPAWKSSTDRLIVRGGFLHRLLFCVLFFLHHLSEFSSCLSRVCALSGHYSFALALLCWAFVLLLNSSLRILLRVIFLRGPGNVVRRRVCSKVECM